jgi:ubiquinone/menaquinone biosynthesis C-methylase UbiE
LPHVTTDLWMETMAAALPTDLSVNLVLDLGSGTGRFSKALSARFSCPVFALDPSFPMLAGCQRAEGVWLVQGWAERIPLADGSVDLVWMSQAFHHLDAPEAAMTEIRRVLARGGMLAVRNATAETDREMLWLRFFPEARDEIKSIIPTREKIVRIVTTAGFNALSARKVDQLFASSYREYCDKIGQRAMSPLVRISDDAFAAGMDRLRRWVDAQPEGIPVHEPLDLFVFQSMKGKEMP